MPNRQLPNPFVSGQVLSAQQLEQMRLVIADLLADEVEAGVGLTKNKVGKKTVLSLLPRNRRKRPPLKHPDNPKEIFDNTIGPDDAQAVTIDVVAGPGDPPDPINDPPYDGWKIWEGVREKWAADKKLYTYKKYTLIDLNGDTTKIVYEEKVLVVEGAPCSGS